MGADVAYPLVLLAAGRSARLGRPKGLVVVDGRAWLERQLAAFAACGGRRAVVVLGHARDEYAATLPWIASALTDEARVESVSVSALTNDDPDRGPFSSLQIGVAALLRSDPSLTAAFVLPIDVPPPDARVWRALAERIDGDVDAVVPVFDGRGGHPVLCAAALLRDVVATPCDAADARLDAKLRACARVDRVDVDDARVAMNLNAPEDWAALTS
jgi:CTP:molybdopterin cytidylyltransferase MocA